MRNHGERAFPVQEHRTKHDEVYIDAELGMTLRDYFAAKALQGMLAYHNQDAGDFHSNSSFQKNAEYAYQQADAMLEARVGAQGEESDRG